MKTRTLGCSEENNVVSKSPVSFLANLRKVTLVKRFEFLITDGIFLTL